MIGFLIFLAVLLVIALGGIGYGIVIYNALVSLKNSIDKAWSNIDVLLKQRFDEIPKLVKVCEGYMRHERQTLEAVIKARSLLETAKNSGETLQAEGAITHALRSLFAVVENYPDLKADVGFRQLQARISELEDQIADRRELFNETVNLYNIRIEQFPDTLISRSFGFDPRELWKIEAAHRADVPIAFSVI
jgi:LemA protein